MLKRYAGEINEKTPLMVLALPMFLEQLLNICINNVDTIMLSRHSENAAGAVGNANQIMFFMILTFNIIATATSVVVAQYLGAKQHKKMNMIYTLAFAVNLVVGIVLSGGLVLIKRPVLELIKIPDVMLEDACIYVDIVGGGLFLQACYNVMLQILRCNGFANVGMYISIIANLLNILGNWLFLYGPLSFLNLGVAGVAIPTVVARGVSLIAAVVYFYRKKIGRLAVRYIRPFPKTMLVHMIKIGLPSAGENMSYNLYQIVLLSFINGMGADAVKANTFCKSLISFAMVFSNTAALATQIITGHLVGAGKEDAAYKRVFQTLKLTMPITVGLAAINWLISPITLKIFTDNQAVIDLGFFIMLVDILIEVGRCLNMTFVSSLKAAGDYLFPFVVGLISMWGFGATMGYVAGIVLGFGVAGVFFGTATDECLRGVVNMWRWWKKKWYGKSLVKNNGNEVSPDMGPDEEEPEPVMANGPEQKSN